MEQKYGTVTDGNITRNVYIMDKATKTYAPKGYLVVQCLNTGITATLPKKIVKNVTTQWPGEC